MRYNFEVANIRKRSRLPHWDVRHGIYFVTFNLNDAIPAAAKQRLLDQVNVQLSLISHSRGDSTEAERTAIWQWLEERLEDRLDESHGHCWMRKERVASVVADALTFFDGKRYRLHAWCVMPNHVHVIFEPQEPFDLASILHSWKSYTSKEANRILGRNGEFWQKDFFDRTIRSSDELQKKVVYVMNNPLVAELFGWRFAKMYPERIAAALG